MNIRPAINMSRDLAEALGLTPTPEAAPAAPGEFRFVVSPRISSFLDAVVGLRKPLNYVWPIAAGLIVEED